MSDKELQADALMLGLLRATNDDERRALMVAASRLAAGISPNDCTENDIEHVGLDRGEQCIICGKVMP